MSANNATKSGFAGIGGNPVANHPEVIRLAKLFAECSRLAVEVEQYLADHPQQCRCRCCAEIRVAETELPTPHLRHYLTTIFTVLDSLGSQCWERRPVSADELREMREELLGDRPVAGCPAGERKGQGKAG